MTRQRILHQLDRDHLLHILRKAGGPIALVFLVLLGGIRLFSSLHLTAPPLRPTAAPFARPNSAANSTSAMFGFDLPHTHVNPSSSTPRPPSSMAWSISARATIKCSLSTYAATVGTWTQETRRLKSRCAPT